jgi:hypothetical protein
MKATGQNRIPSLVAQALFIFWLIVVNILFYLQFRALASSRLPHWLSRWHL